MDRRLKLDSILREAPGNNKVYFAEETKNNMQYPCIRYSLSGRNYLHADNKKYAKFSVYTATYITRKPSDSIQIIDYLENLPATKAIAVFDRPYVQDGLYHYVFTITL